MNIKMTVPKLSKEAKETKVKEPKLSKVDKVSNETNVSILQISFQIKNIVNLLKNVVQNGQVFYRTS